MRVLVGDGLNLFLKVNMNKDEDQKSSTSSHARDHMANEGIFLAWIRTSIGIMAFGFEQQYLKSTSHISIDIRGLNEEKSAKPDSSLF